MGYRRAGWYAFERFDNDNIPSAEEIIPTLQHLHIGQVIGEEGLAVQAIEPNRLLLLAFHYPKTEWVLKQGFWPKFGDCSWSILLDPIDGGQRTAIEVGRRSSQGFTVRRCHMLLASAQRQPSTTIARLMGCNAAFGAQRHPRFSPARTRRAPAQILTPPHDP